MERRAFIGEEERWIRIAHEFMLLYPEWYLFSKERTLDELMRLSGGSLNPNFVRNKIDILFEEL